MQDIVVVEKVESIEEKRKKYEATGYPDRFIKMDEEYKILMQKYELSNSVDKMLRAIADDTILIIYGETIINFTRPVFVKRSEAGPILKSINNVPVSRVETMVLPEYIGKYDDYTTGREFFRPAQGKLIIRLSPRELATRLYKPPVYRKWMQIADPEKELEVRELLPNIPIRPSLLPQFKVLSKLFDISLFACGLIYNFSRDFFMNALNGHIDEVYIKRFKEMVKKAEEAKDEINRSVVESIKEWMIRTFNLSGNKVFTANDLKILKANHVKINNKFLVKPCEHMLKYNIKDLKLVGDFLVCSHGNQIKCRHAIVDRIQNIDAFIEEFAIIIGFETLCKFCGERLYANPALSTNSGGPRADSSSINDETRKFIFKKCLIASAHITFEAFVSEEYVMKLCGNITSNVMGKVIKEFIKIDKLRGVDAMVISSMKEIVAQLYVMCAFVLLAEKNRQYFIIRGTKKMTVHKTIEMTIDILRNILKNRIEAVRDLRDVNISNLVYAIMEDLKNRPPKAPRELNSYDVRDTCVYKAIEPYADDIKKYPDVSIKADGFKGDILRFIVKNVMYTGYIGQPNENGVIVYSDKFNEIIKELKILREKEYKVFNELPLRKFLGALICDKPKFYTYDLKYCGLAIGIKGGVHTHKFTKGYVDGKIIKNSDVPLNEIVTNLVCEICGGEMEYKNLEDQINVNLILKSKIEYFSVYCPVNFQHIFSGGKCKYCGYLEAGDNTTFYSKNELPTKYIKVPKESAKPDIINFKPAIKVLDVNAKYYGKTAKVAYYNFWLNFGCYEDVTFSQFISGKHGNRIAGINKIQMSFAWLNGLLARIHNIKFMPDAKLQEFAGPNLEPIIKKILEILESNEKPEYNNYKNKFINIFNELPAKIAEMVVSDLIKFAQRTSKSEESEHASALVAYRNKEIYDNTDIDENDTGKKDDLYEGFDYDGKNDKQ